MESYLKYSKAIVTKRLLPESDLSIIHLSSIRKWRGGEQQVINLVEQLRVQGVYNHLVVAKNSELAQYCRKHKLPYTTINYLNGFNFFAALKIKALTRRLNVDIIHMHCSPSHTLGIASYILGNKSKLVLTRRVIYPIKSRFLSLKKYNFSGIERIICVSRAIRDVLAEQIKRENVFSVVYDGVDIDRITAQKKERSIRQEFQLSDKILVSIIAALSPEKDHITFLNAAKIILESGGNFHFLVVGAGKEEENIKAYIDKLGLTANVTMTGFRNDIPNVLNEINYFTLTSTEEGLGSSILEAFANKTPVVATAAGGIPEVVIHGETGLLATKGDAPAIANHILELEMNHGLRQALIDKAYQTIQNKFNIELSASQTADIYRDIIVNEAKTFAEVVN
jgi:glycosyltransferase involved in cell wall biosynthesis